MVQGRRLTERFGRYGFKMAVVLCMLFIIMPLLLVCWLSVFSNTIMSMPPQGYSLKWYGEMLRQPQFISGLVNSALIAAGATVGGLVLTLPASFALARLRFRGRDTVLQFLMLPLIVPAIVIGSALYMMFVAVEISTGVPLTGSIWGLTIGHILLTIPWSVRLVTANLIGVNPAIEEAALSLGATPFVTAMKITLPNIWPGLVAAALFSFVISFSNLEVSMFLVSAGETTLPIAVLQYLQWKIDPTVAAISVLQIVVVGTGLMLTNRFISLTKAV
ncbi:ABC transporter permease [Phyllobacterium sp. SB3]|uniref:ABC transporter permease n=1 Tax=Phyllobacterium sp. SB3 TaxID=3156073 RepID=UPI0032AE8576